MGSSRWNRPRERSILKAAVAASQEDTIMPRNRGWLAWLPAVVVLVCFATESAAQTQPRVQPRHRIAYATYVGGSANEQLREVIPYPDGSVLVGGQTHSSDLPVTEGVVQPRYGGEPPGRGHPGIFGGDCFLLRLGPQGRAVRFATFFGGSKQERNVYGMALDSAGNIVITSSTRSADLPTTPGAFQRRYGGGPSDWMVAKLSADCRRLLWCTYVGGGADESPRGGLAVDATDHVYVVGGTGSRDFPVTPRAFQRAAKGDRDAAVVKLKPDGSGIVFCTRLGGGGRDGLMGVRVGPKGSVHVAGHTRSADFPVTDAAPQRRHGGMSDAFFASLSADGSKLLYATYLGGAKHEFAEHRPALLADGSVLLAGVTASADFPTTRGACQRTRKGGTDGFLTKLAAGGRRFAFSTLLGGSQGEFYLMPTTDRQGNIFLVGQTASRDFPVTPDALQSCYGGGPGDGALAVLSRDGSKLLYATYLGGSGDDLIRSLALAPGGAIYLVGSTRSKDFPVTAGAASPKLRGRSDAFVVKLVPAP
jgi:hypothetical protein